MPELSWTTLSPLQGALVRGRHGEQNGDAGILLSELRDFALVQVMARRGKWPEVVKVAMTHFGVGAPASCKAVKNSDGALIWSGPDQFLALFRSTMASDQLDAFKLLFKYSASISDQSGGRALIEISGSNCRDMLAKLCSLDLHPNVFQIGSAAVTSIDHTSVSLWRDDDNPEGHAVFRVLALSSFAESLWHTILDASAEYGTMVR